MNPHHPGESFSVWSESVTMPSFDPLTHDLMTDVCVIGGGIAGLTTAYLLMKEGKRVCILEAFEIAGGQTSKTTAHLSNVLGTRYLDLEKYHGKKGAKLIAESHASAIQKIADIITEEKIECDFTYLNGYLFRSGESSVDLLENELACCQHAGITNLKIQETLPTENFPPTQSLVFSDQAQFNPLKYLKRLTEILVTSGVEIFSHTFVDEIKGGSQVFVKTRFGTKVKCLSIVVATHSPVNDLLAIHTKQYAYRTYAMAFRIPEGKIEKALYWDTAEPYHYLRLAAPDVLIVGGEDHKTGQQSHPEKSYENLEVWLRSQIPYAGEVLFKWSGQVMESMDGIGFMGHNPADSNNVYVITGDSGNGMTHATIGAMLITDQIQGRKNSFESLYNPSRISLRALPTFIQENSNVAAQYIDWLTPKTVTDLDEIKGEQGGVLQMGLQMVAAYKDENGNAHLMSAACPHLGGLVSWNQAEKSWDCPCHGSRFDCHGKVIEGPATSDLEKIARPGLLAQPIPTGELDF